MFVTRIATSAPIVKLPEQSKSLIGSWRTAEVRPCAVVERRAVTQTTDISMVRFPRALVNVSPVETYLNDIGEAIEEIIGGSIAHAQAVDRDRFGRLAALKHPGSHGALSQVP